jgi:hypothetical protein
MKLTANRPSPWHLIVTSSRFRFYSCTAVASRQLMCCDLVGARGWVTAVEVIGSCIIQPRDIRSKVEREREAGHSLTVLLLVPADQHIQSWFKNKSKLLHCRLDTRNVCGWIPPARRRWKVWSYSYSSVGLPSIATVSSWTTPGREDI